MMMRRSGVSLIEILLGLLIVTIASVATLQYFAYGKGSIAKQGNRRAALERARERLEQALSASVGALPPQTGQLYYCSAGNPCTTWTASGTPISQTDPVTGRRMETTAQWVDDPSAGTGTGNLDIVDLGVKMWFMPGSTDDNFNRVVMRTLRTLS